MMGHIIDSSYGLKIPLAAAEMTCKLLLETDIAVGRRNQKDSR